MFALVISALLLLSSPDGDKDKLPAPAPAPRSVVLRTAPARATPAAPANSWNARSSAGRNGRVWANFGYGIIADEYDDSGEMHPLAEGFAANANAAIGTPSVGALAGQLGIALPPSIPASLLNASRVNGLTGVAEGEISGEVDVVNVHLGGLYNLVQKERFSLGLGLDLGLSQQNFTAKEATAAVTINTSAATVTGLAPVGIPNGAPLAAVGQALGVAVPASVTLPPTVTPSDRVVKSGFKTQNATLFCNLSSSMVGARLGFMYDFGPEPNLLENERENTDRQHAIVLSVNGRHPLGALVLLAGAEGFLTLDGEEFGAKFDEGDVYGLHAGAGYDFGFGEIGAALTYRLRTDGDNVRVLEGQVFTIPSEAGFHVGLAPYLNIAPQGSPYTFYVKGGVQDEYRDYTLSLIGENDFAPHLGATFGVMVDF